MQEFGLDVLYSSKTFRWGDIKVPMVPRGHWDKFAISSFRKKHAQELQQAEKNELRLTRKFEETVALSKILAAKYDPIDVDKVIGKQDHLSNPERSILEKILKLRTKCFQGKRGSWKGKPVNLELIPGAASVSARPSPIPQAYSQLVKDEADRFDSRSVIQVVQSFLCNSEER